MVSFCLGRQSWVLISAPRTISLLYLSKSLEKSQLKIARGVFIAEKKKISNTCGKREFSSSFNSQLTSSIQEENTSLSFEKQNTIKQASLPQIK